jgi:hypothetical protein
MIYGCDDSAIHRFGWSPIHVWQFKNLTRAIPIAYIAMTYFFEKPAREETDYVKGFLREEMFAEEYHCTVSMYETTTCQI